MTPEQIETVAALLSGNEQAHANFLAMPPSVRKTYTRAYFDAKTEAGRAQTPGLDDGPAGKKSKAHVMKAGDYHSRATLSDSRSCTIPRILSVL